MKHLIKIITLSLLVAISFSACKTTNVYVIKKHPHGMPPGQAKKISGDKSAKKHAPGQKKKH
jgi:hypothetical protein